MNTNTTVTEPRYPGGLPEFLDTLNQIYECLDLGPDDAWAATFADAEIFVAEPVEPGLAA